MLKLIVLVTFLFMLNNVISGSSSSSSYSSNENYSDEDDSCESNEEVSDQTCSLPPESGLCNAAIPRYYYDTTKKDCILFNYGGCGGNGNNYENKTDCLNKCSVSDQTCSLPPESGLCDAAIPRYYYDTTKKDCILFNYGGCGGNGNNYENKTECLNKCSGIEQ